MHKQPVHNKCKECAKYSEKYVVNRSAVDGVARIIHGCGSKACSAVEGFQKFQPKSDSTVPIYCGSCGRSKAIGAGNCEFYCFNPETREYPNWIPKGTMGAPGVIEGKTARQIITDDLEGSAKTSSHYQVGTKQPIEIMQEVMTQEEFQGFLRGNVIKYSLRLGHKDAAVKEAAKIEQYAKWLRMALEGKTIKPMDD